MHLTAIARLNANVSISKIGDQQPLLNYLVIPSIKSDRIDLIGGAAGALPSRRVAAGGHSGNFTDRHCKGRNRDGVLRPDLLHEIAETSELTRVRVDAFGLTGRLQYPPGQAVMSTAQILGQGLRGLLLPPVPRRRTEDRLP